MTWIKYGVPGDRQLYLPPWRINHREISISIWCCFRKTLYRNRISRVPDAGIFPSPFEIKKVFFVPEAGDVLPMVSPKMPGPSFNIRQLKLSYRFEIWRAPRQQCCRGACQISERLNNPKYKCRGFETSRDLTVRRLIGCWNRACLWHHTWHTHWLTIRQSPTPGPRLNIKTVLSTYGDFHVKDKTAVRTSYL